MSTAGYDLHEASPTAPLDILPATSRNYPLARLILSTGCQTTVYSHPLADFFPAVGKDNGGDFTSFPCDFEASGLDSYTGWRVTNDPTATVIYPRGA